MKTKIVIFISALFIITWPLLLQSQSIITTAGTVSDCPVDIVVPITVDNCYGVGAISLVLEFNTGTLSFLNYENLHPALSSGFLIVNPSGGKVIISWASTSAANIGSGTLMDLRFTGVTGSSNLTWDTQTPGNCEYSDAGGNIFPATYTNGTATVYQVPEIQTQPVDKSALVGDNVTFSIGAIAQGLERLWYRSTDGGVNWYSTGVTSANLTVNNVSLDMDGYLYRCEISGTCDPVAVSDPAMLSVVQPLITSFDVQSVCPGEIHIPVLTSNFTDVAAFSLAFSYNTSVLSWSGYQAANPALGGNLVCNEINGKVYMTWSSTTPVTFGADTTLVEILFSGTAGSSNLNWDLTTPGNCEYIYLNAEEIISVFDNNSFTIYAIPQVTVQPIDKLIPENTNTSFSISATGSGLSYQWQYSSDDGSNWNELSGATNSTYNISNATLGMDGFLFRCVVSGNCTPDAISDPAELRVLPKITALAETVSDCPGTIIVSVDVTHFIDVATFSLALSFNESVLSFDNYQSLNGLLSSGEFVLNAAGGVVWMSWASLAPATLGDDQLLELVFTGTTGSTVLDWLNEAEGNCEFGNINGDIIFDNYINGNVTVYMPPVIVTNPTNKTIPAQSVTSFSCNASGTALNYHWQVSTDNGGSWNNLVNVSPYSGVTTATMQINPVSWPMDGNLYRCHVTGACPPEVYSTGALLDVIPEVIGTSVGNITNSCTGNISVPVFVSNCNNVGAISLALNYDPAKISFNGYSDPHSELSGGMLIVNSTGSKVIMSWASINAANIGSGILINFEFSALPGTSTTVSWDTQTPGNCEYSSPDGFIYVTSFTSGNISVAANALIVDAGSDETISPGGSVQLNGTVNGGTTPYQIAWSPSTWLSNPAILNPLADPPSTTTYTLMVTDDAGCVATDQMIVNVTTAGIDVDLKAFLEGPFEIGEMSTTLNNRGFIPSMQPYSGLPWNYGGTESVGVLPNANISDWVLVELRETSGSASSATGSTMIARQAGFILKNGEIVATDGNNLMHFDVFVSQNLYVVIWQRNHLAVMSSGPLPNTAGTYSWDFTTGLSKAYGTNAQANLGGGAYGLFAGDADANGIVELTDISGNWKNQAGNRGYRSADMDMDGEVNNQDKNETWITNHNEQSQVPE